jgi:hypothetical protein
MIRIATFAVLVPTPLLSSGATPYPEPFGQGFCMLKAVIDHRAGSANHLSLFGIIGLILCGGKEQLWFSPYARCSTAPCG